MESQTERRRESVTINGRTFEVVALSLRGLTILGDLQRELASPNGKNPALKLADMAAHLAGVEAADMMDFTPAEIADIMVVGMRVNDLSELKKKLTPETSTPGQ